MEIIKTDSWEDFLANLADVRKRLFSDNNNMQSLLFRGHADANWNLVTTLERNNKDRMKFLEYYGHIYSIKAEIESSTEKEWMIPEYAELSKRLAGYTEFSFDLIYKKYPAYEYLAYLRHHGFPSPLLDWSRSAYVAAFFAFGDISTFGELPLEVSIYLLCEKRTKFGNNGTARIYRLGPNVKTHRRHFLQQSEYTMCLNFKDDWEFEQHTEGLISIAEFENSMKNFELIRFDLPSTEKNKVLGHLDEHNLNAFSLFASEESLMKTLAFRELSDHRNSNT